MKKFFIYFLVASLIITSVNLTFAEEKVVEAVGYYTPSPAEDVEVAKDRARAAAKRSASEQAGIFVETISEVRQGKLTRDEIRTVSATVLRVQDEVITEENLGDAKIQYCCKLIAVVDTSSVAAQLDPKEREKFNEAMRRIKELEAENLRLNAEISTLKKQYTTASEPERKKIVVEIKRNEEKFTAAQLSERGLEQYNRDNYGKAIEFYQKALDLDKNYSDAWTGLGWVYRSTGDYDKAIESFQKAVQIDEKNASAWNGLGYAYNYKDQFDKAIEFCSKAVEIDPTYAAPCNNLGYAYNKLGNFEKAIEYYKKATTLDAKDASPWSNIGSAYDEMGDYDKAIEYCNKAVAIDDKDAKIWSNLGYAYSHKGDFDRAVEDFEKAVKFDSKNAVAWNGLGYAYNYKKNFGKAARCCRKAVDLDPTYANAWNGLGYAYGGLNRPKDSLKAYQKAVELAPEVEMYRKNFETAKKRVEGKMHELFQDNK